MNRRLHARSRSSSSKVQGSAVHLLTSLPNNASFALTAPLSMNFPHAAILQPLYRIKQSPLPRSRSSAPQTSRPVRRHSPGQTWLRGSHPLQLNSSDTESWRVVGRLRLRGGRQPCDVTLEEGTGTGARGTLDWDRGLSGATQPGDQ